MKTYAQLNDIDVKDKRVLVRVDYNVPLKDGKVSDATRIAASIPTIRFLLEHNAKIILMSHLGRPDGKPKLEFSLRPIIGILKQLLMPYSCHSVTFVNECTGNDVKKAVDNLAPGSIILLENLRFHPEEEKNDAGFAKQLAQNADIYVNDAFGAAHRSHASVDAITDYLPSAAGFLLDRELQQLSKVAQPEHPFLCILGGLKISDKIKTIEQLAGKADLILIGGAMANSFLKAKGLEIGKSKYDAVENAEALLKRHHAKILLPEDVVVADKYDNAARQKTIPVDQVPSDWMILDIGPETVKLFNAELKKAKSIFWNGPLGAFELSSFSKGTADVAQFAARLKCTTIIGGGDSADAVTKLGLQDKFAHVSTGGGASLEFLEGKKLPAIEALERSYKRIKN